MSGDRIEASKRMVEETQRLYEPLGISLGQQLARPTFRLILELVRKLNAETRILKEVFNPSELAGDGPAKQQQQQKSGSGSVPRRWQDRQAKCDFVQRLIDFVANNKQPVIGCLASKVVAGLEPNKTNELLQSLARVAHLKRPGARPARPGTFTRDRRRSSANQRASPGAPKDSSLKEEADQGRHREEEVRVSRLDPEPQRPQEAEQGARVAGKTAVSATPSPTSSPAQASESDIGRDLPRLRANLRGLRAKLADLADLEDLLRDGLNIALRGRKQSPLEASPSPLQLRQAMV